jgi:diaminopimelate decarboxylase
MPEQPAPGGPAIAVAGLPPALLTGVPTPAYVYDLAEVRASAAALRQALPSGAALYYSLKANPHPAVLSTLLAAGLRAEVCSPGEVAAAAEAGFPPGEMLLNGPGKRDRDIDDALHSGIRHFSVDSPFGLDQLGRRAARAAVDVSVLLRVNDEQPAPGQGLAMTGVASQFGADAGWILADPARFTGAGRARVTGLHLYMGTNMTSVPDLVSQFAQSLRTARRVAQALTRAGAQVTVLDLGGGFGAPYARAGGRIPLDGLRGELDRLIADAMADWPGEPPAMSFESGRYLTATAGTLLTRVLDVKASRGHRVVVLDSGINHLGGMPGLRRLRPLAPELLAVGPSAATPEADRGGTGPAMVCGPLCTPLDSWSRDAQLPPLAPGDLVAVPNVGAYGLYASLVAFLGHPLPAEVVVDRADTEHPLREATRLELVRVLAGDRAPRSTTSATPSQPHLKEISWTHVS